MKAAFENNMERGRGYALLRLSEVANSSLGGWRFSLCRASDMTYLGRSGWQNSEDFTEPETYIADGDSLILHIGPDVVDRLDPNENYRVTIQSDGSSQSATFAIATLNRTLMDTQGNISTKEAQKSTAPVPDLEPEQPVDPEPEQLKEPEEPNKSRLAKILAVLLVLALIGGGALAFWFMRKGPSLEPLEVPLTSEQAKKEPELEPEKEDESAKSDPPVPSPKSEGDSKPNPIPTRERVNTYLRGNPTLQGAGELAATLPQESAEDQDAVYRLWFFAADAGDVAANFDLARTVDPALPAWGSITKNGAEAWSLYAKAAPEQPEAADAMQALKQWLEREAEKGNADAIGWIRTIAEDSAKK